MKTYDINKKIEYSDEKPIKKHFLNSKGFHTALICLKKGVEISPHEEDYAVFLMVLEGKGVFIDIKGEHTLSKNQGIYMKKDEIRGIKAEEDLVVLGVQDRAKGVKNESI